MTATEHDLPRCVLFEALTPAERQELLSLMEPAAYEAGTAILEEGKQTRGLWLITRGRCEVVKAMPGGGFRVLAELGPGALFGEMSFFEPAPHSATVRCTTDAAVLKLTPNNYARLEHTGLRAAHKIAHVITGVLSERLRRMDEWTSELLGCSPVEKREEWSDFRAKLYNGWGF